MENWYAYIMGAVLVVHIERVYIGENTLAISEVNDVNKS